MSSTWSILPVALMLAFPASAGVFGKPIPVAGPDVGFCGAVELDGRTLFAGTGDFLTAYDVSEPLKPKILSSLRGFDAVRQLRACNGFVYVVSRETGLRIVDARNPSAMKIRSRFDTVEFATGVEVVGEVAFISERINGVEAVDVSDPDRPTHIAIRQTPESQSCRYSDGCLYSGEWGVGRVTVFSAADMADFREIGNVRLGGYGDGVEVAGGLLLASTGHDSLHGVLKGEDAVGRGRGLDVFSLKDQSGLPRHLARVDFPRLSARDRDFWTPRAAGGFVFCADSHNGLFAVDVHDPSAAKVIDRLCIPMPSRKDLPSSCAASLAVGDGCLYVMFVPVGGLQVVPVKGVKPIVRDHGKLPRNVGYRSKYPTHEAQFYVYRPTTPGQARRVQVVGDVAYVAFGDAGLHVLKISESGFAPLGKLQGVRQVNDCLVMGNRLVTAEGAEGFAVYGLEGDGLFREIARRRDAGAFGSIAFWLARIDERRLALSGRSGGFGVFSIGDFTAAKAVATFSGSCNWDRYTPEGAIGGIFPLFVPYGGVTWVDLRDDEPTVRHQKLSRSEVGVQTDGIVEFGGRFLMTCGKGYRFVETDGRMGPVIRPDGMRHGIPRTDGRIVVLTNRSGRFVQVWDFAQPESPKRLAEYGLTGNPDLAALWRGRAVIPAGHQGVLLERRGGER